MFLNGFCAHARILLNAWIYHFILLHAFLAILIELLYASGTIWTFSLHFSQLCIKKTYFFALETGKDEKFDQMIAVIAFLQDELSEERIFICTHPEGFDDGSTGFSRKPSDARLAEAVCTSNESCSKGPFAHKMGEIAPNWSRSSFGAIALTHCSERAYHGTHNVFNYVEFLTVNNQFTKNTANKYTRIASCIYRVTVRANTAQSKFIHTYTQSDSYDVCAWRN